MRIGSSQALASINAEHCLCENKQKISQLDDAFSIVIVAEASWVKFFFFFRPEFNVKTRNYD